MSQKLEALKKDLKAAKKERAALEKKIVNKKAKNKFPAFMAKESKY